MNQAFTFFTWIYNWYFFSPFTFFCLISKIILKPSLLCFNALQLSAAALTWHSFSTTVKPHEKQKDDWWHYWLITSGIFKLQQVRKYALKNSQYMLKLYTHSSSMNISIKSVNTYIPNMWRIGIFGREFAAVANSKACQHTNKAKAGTSSCCLLGCTASNVPTTIAFNQLPSLHNQLIPHSLHVSWLHSF